MNDYSYVLYSEKSVLATDCYDLTPLTYEERGMLPAKKTTENGFLEETRFLGDLEGELRHLNKEITHWNAP